MTTYTKDGSGNKINPQRALRRSLGWPSGRQWRKWRKANQTKSV